MRITIATAELQTRSGAELHVAEIAGELHRRGHEVVVLSSVLGPLAETVRASGVDTTSRAGDLGAADVVYGHAAHALVLALSRDDRTPAMFLSHQHEAWRSRVDPHPRIRRYAGVSRVCVDDLLGLGAPPERTSLLPNFVETDRFARRAPLPAAPRRALVFSNYAEPGARLDAVRAGCERAGVELEVAGRGVGRILDAPELVLPGFDVVFAKGRAALEALAVGCAVVLSDYAGLGPMVSSARYGPLREMNFGFEALTGEHTAETVQRALDAYDPVDASAVTDRVRRDASLGAHVDRLELLLAEVATDAVTAPISGADRRRAARADLLFRRWTTSPSAVRRVAEALLPIGRRITSPIASGPARRRRP